MTIPKRHSQPEDAEAAVRCFFLTSCTWGRRALLQTDAMASLLIDVLFHYRNQGLYRLHAFVVMRNHFHALITLAANVSIERTAQHIKGGFSYRAKRELGRNGEIWQRGFSEERVANIHQFEKYREYIHNNPVRAGMVVDVADYPFSSANPRYRSTATGAKAGSN